MPYGDPTSTPPDTGAPSGLGNALPSFFFPTPPKDPSLRLLAVRAQIAKELASRRRGYPANVGQGLTEVGDALGARGAMAQLAAEDAAYEQAAQRAATPPGLPPTAPAGRTAANPYDFGNPGSPATYAGITGVPDEARSPGLAASVPSWLRSFNGASDGGADAESQSAAADETGNEPAAGPYQVASLGGVPAPAQAPAAVAAVPAELPPNPPIMTDIAPMPQTAQLGNVPPPTAKPTSEPAPQYQKTPQAPLKLYEEPAPPRKSEAITSWEAQGYSMLRGRFADDPRVQATAKQLIEYGAGQRAADFERETKKYELQRAEYEKQQAYQREYGAKDVETQTKARELQQKTQEAEHFGGGTQAQAFDIIKESHKEVRPLIATIAQIQNAQRVIDQAYTGAGGKLKLDAARVLSAMNLRRDPAISATQQLQGYVASTIGGLRSQVAGPGSQSEKELAKLEVATGDNITLDPTAIKAILGSIEKSSLISAAEHQQKLLTYSGTDPNRTRQAYGNFSLPIWNMLPASTVQIFKEHYKQNPAEALKEMDDDYSTPGLGLKILQHRR